MFILYTLLVLAYLTGVFFAWAYIHEVAHLYVAKRTVGYEWAEIKPYPHVDPEAGFRWAAFRYLPKRLATPEETFRISLAPRVPDLAATLLLVLGLALLPLNWWTFVPLAFLGGGWVDFITGSLPRGFNHDLSKAFRAKEWGKGKRALFALASSLVILAPLATLVVRFS